MGRLTTRHNEFQGYQANWADQNSLGSTVTPGSSNAKGSWLDLMSGTLTDDAFGIRLEFGNGSGGTHTLADIGIDASGGTTYRVLIPNLICGSAQNIGSIDSFGHVYYFPLFMPAGSRLGIRAQQSLGTVVSFDCRAKLLQKPSRPEELKTGSFVDAIGVNTATSQGTVLTLAGASFTEGPWNLLGSAPRDGFHMQYGVGANAAGGDNVMVDFGVGDGTTNRILYPDHWFGSVSGEVTNEYLPSAWYFATVKAGQNVYSRANFNSGVNTMYAAAYLTGGFGH